MTPGVRTRHPVATPARAARTRIRPAGLVIAALAGAWTAHSLEYLRVWGSRRFPDAMVRSAHAYMGPFGVALLLLAVAALYASARLVGRLERRLADLRRLVRGPRGTVGSWSAPAGSDLGLPTVVAVLWVAQLCVYLAQENLEARAFGLSAPGLAALSGVHALAPVVHLLVAILFGGLVWLARRRVSQLVGDIERHEARLALRAHPPAVRDRCAHGPTWTPLQRWGAQLWARPPPLAA